MLSIHNSLTGEKEEFKPLRPNEVRMYVCGITVYDYIHLGHARMLTVFDLVQRYLRSLGFDEMACLEVAHIVGIFNYLTRLADGFGLELHPALMEAARSGIPLRRADG